LRIALGIIKRKKKKTYNIILDLETSRYGLKKKEIEAMLKKVIEVANDLEKEGYKEAITEEKIGIK